MRTKLAAPGPAPLHAGRRAGLALGFGVVLAGCVWDGGDKAGDGDGTKCGAQERATAVYIDVTYDAQGMPAVDPVQCTIDSGTQVTWRGPVGEPVEFEIRFKGPSPVLRDERGTLPSEETDRRHKVRRTLGGAAGSYPYGVRANGKELDPAIIIR